MNPLYKEDVADWGCDDPACTENPHPVSIRVEECAHQSNFSVALYEGVLSLYCCAPEPVMLFALASSSDHPVQRKRGWLRTLLGKRA